MIQFVRYYLLPLGRNAGVVAAFGEWPERVLKHRGWTADRLVCRRVATEEEHLWLAKCSRYQALHFPTVESCLASERDLLSPKQLEPIEALLRRAVREYPDLLGKQTTAALESGLVKSVDEEDEAKTFHP